MHVSTIMYCFMNGDMILFMSTRSYIFLKSNLQQIIIINTLTYSFHMYTNRIQMRKKEYIFYL